MLVPALTERTARWKAALVWILAITAATMLTAQPVNAQEPDDLCIAPLNPQFEEYMQTLAGGRLGAMTEGGRFLGLIPSPLDLSHLKDGTYTGEEGNVGVRVICDPSGYTSANYVLVTGISSCFKNPPVTGQVIRRILTRDGDDVVKLVGP